MVTSGNLDDVRAFLTTELSTDITRAMEALRAYKTETNKMAGMTVTEENAIEMLRVYTLALHSELNELLAEFNWKPWKKTQKPVDVKHAAKEFGDILAFIGTLITALDAMGISPQILSDGYVSAELENLRRFNGEY